MIFQIVVIDVDGYETYGDKRNVGFYSTLEEAKRNLPSEENMSAEYAFGIQRTPFFNGVLSIIEHGLDNNQYSKLAWSENALAVCEMFD